MDCQIIEPSVPILNSNCCRICGLIKPKKDFRRIWSLRKEKDLPIRVWCKACQQLFKKSRAFPITDSNFVIDLI